MRAIALADTTPVVWGGSVLAARAARRVAESLRRSSGRSALAGDAEHLLPLIEAARQRGNHMRVPATRSSISRLMAAIRNCLSPRRRSIDGAAVPSFAGAALLPLPLEEPRPRPDARSIGLSQPYAGMVVLVRGTSAQSAAQPCAASDC